MLEAVDRLSNVLVDLVEQPRLAAVRSAQALGSSILWPRSRA